MLTEVPSASTTCGVATTNDSAEVGSPATNVTVVAAVTEPTVATTIFVSAFVEERWKSIVPFEPWAVERLVASNELSLPVAAMETVWFVSGVPYESVTVTAIVACVEPSATTLLLVAEIDTTVWLSAACVNATGAVSSGVVELPTSSETVSLCAVGEVSVAKNRPLPLVEPVSVLPPVRPADEKVLLEPDASSFTCWFAMGLLFASCRTTSRLVLPPATRLDGAICSSEVAALAVPATNVTARELLAEPAYALTNTVPLFVAESVVVSTPFEFVVPLAVPSVAPLPLAVNVTV